MECEWGGIIKGGSWSEVNKKDTINNSERDTQRQSDDKKIIQGNSATHRDKHKKKNKKTKHKETPRIATSCGPTRHF